MSDICPQCQSNNWQKETSGYKYCLNCHTRSEYVPDEVEMEIDHRTGALHNIKIRLGHVKDMSYNEEFQMVLNKQAEYLIIKKGYPTEVYDTIGELWFQYVLKTSLCTDGQVEENLEEDEVPKDTEILEKRKKKRTTSKPKEKSKGTYLIFKIIKINCSKRGDLPICDTTLQRFSSEKSSRSVEKYRRE